MSDKPELTAAERRLIEDVARIDWGVPPWIYKYFSDEITMMVQSLIERGYLKFTKNERHLETTDAGRKALDR